jgi:hypothetical protein
MKFKQIIGTLLILASLGMYGVDNGYISVNIEWPDFIPSPMPSPPEVLYSIVIAETSTDQLTPEHSVVLHNVEVRELFKDGHFRVIDPDTPVTADLQQFKDKAKTRAVDKPTLFLVEPNGKVHYEGDLPNTVNEFKTLVNKIKGG